MPSNRTPTLAALLVATGLLLTACSSSGESGTASAGNAAAPAIGSASAAAPALDSAAVQRAGGFAQGDPAYPAASSAAAASAAPSAAAAGGSAAGGSGTALSGNAPRLIRNAQVSFEVTNLIDAANRVRAAASAFNGAVSSETTGFSADAKPLPVANAGTASAPATVAGESVIVLRVPEPQLDNAIASLTGVNGKGGVGKLLTRTASSQDVTGDVADLASRVATAKASVARVRVLLDKAQRLQDIVLLESELTRRESDLEAFQGRLAALTDRADLATLTVLLQTAEPVTKPKPAPAKENSFLTGLRQGWHAVIASMTIVLTILGALLPVAIVLLLVGWPAMIVTNRLRRRRPAGSTPPPAGPAADPRVPAGAGTGPGSTTGGGPTP